MKRSTSHQYSSVRNGGGVARRMLWLGPVGVVGVLWTGNPDAALSHETALAVHDLCDINPSAIHVFVPKGARIRRSRGESYVLHSARSCSIRPLVDRLPAAQPPEARGRTWAHRSPAAGRSAASRARGAYSRGSYEIARPFDRAGSRTPQDARSHDAPSPAAQLRSHSRSLPNSRFMRS